MGMGEMCRYKNRAKETLRSDGDGYRFHKGMFLGVNRRDGQYMLWGEGQVQYARTVMRLPEEMKWSGEQLQTVSATPHDLHSAPEPEVVFKRTGEKEQVEKMPIAQARNIYIRAPDLEAFGHTRGFPRCEHEIRYGPHRLGKPHSDVCRARID